MSAFVMPSLGSDMEDGTLVEQTLAAGSTVARGDIIGAVETQKGVIEIEAFEEGILENWLVDIGTCVPVGTPLAMIRTPDDTAQEPPEIPQPAPAKPTPLEEPVQPDPSPEPPPPEDPPPSDPASPTPTPELPQEAPMPEVTSPPPQSQMSRMTPAARRLAAQRGLDISDVPPGRDGTVTRADVADYAPKPAKPDQSDMRAAIAATMSRAKREIPHYYLTHQLDLHAADAFVTKTNADRPPEMRMVLGALYAKAIARALRKYKDFNGHYENNAFAPGESVNIGMAINIRGGGLVAPALFDVDTKPLDTVMRELSDLVTRVRAGRFRARELSGATITLTSLGERGVDGLYGIIYPPQVAIVGIGTPRLQPMIHQGQVTARLSATLTLAADHRVSDGRRGALFLRAIETQLQSPETL